MCNRVRASFEFRELKVRWNIFNDLPEFKPSQNVTPDQDGRIAIVRSERGNEVRSMYWPLTPSFAERMDLPFSTVNARDDRLLETRTYSRLPKSRKSSFAKTVILKLYGFCVIRELRIAIFIN